MPILSILLAPAVSGHLYLDPGSGSYILQLLLAAMLGGAFAIKVYWRRIVAFFRKDKAGEALDPDGQDSADDE